MGAGCTKTQPAQDDTPAKPPPKRGAEKSPYAQNKPGGKASSPSTKPKEPAKKEDNTKPAGAEGSSPDFAKHLAELSNQFCLLTASNKTFYACCLSKKETNTVEFGCVVTSGDTQTAFIASFAEGELNVKRENVQISSWAVFFKSIRTAFATKKISCKDANATVSLLVSVEGSKKDLSFLLKAQSSCVTVVHQLFLGPLMSFAQQRLAGRDDERFQQVEVELNGLRGSCSALQQKKGALESEVNTMRDQEKVAQEDCRAAKQQKEEVERRIVKLSHPSQSEANSLYPDAPMRYILHTPHAPVHIPKPLEPNKTALHYIKQKFGVASGDAPLASNLAHEDIMKVLDKIDDWDYDVFALDKHSNGGALFLTTYALLYQYELVQHFGISEAVLCNFLSAVQSGYHPNPYHNATHAADVLQITHYILGPGGMGEQIQITKEDQLAALIASAIHDYDHPGFNNNFHCRTNSYLATLYNDRSVLENHHAAQVFELMKNTKYDILSSLGFDSRREVRDTVIEMVLSTDMGNHAKIFQQFRKRLAEEQEWVKREDQRLALSIAIKMADISNCGRNHDLYMEWANRIADEFYAQGDVEAKLKFTISPFMDRKKYKTDFPKGQISFMNYIVIPLFEAGANFLPKMEFTVKKIQENKEHWKKKEEVE